MSLDSFECFCCPTNLLEHSDMGRQGEHFLSDIQTIAC